MIRLMNMSVSRCRRCLRTVSISTAAAAALLGQAVLTTPSQAHEGFANLIESLSPSVVNISVISKSRGSSKMPQLQIPEGTPFEKFFREFMEEGEGESAERRSMAAGSGFIISGDGLIVTNNHVIENAVKIYAETHTGVEFEAEVVGVDPKTDIALLKVEPSEALPFVGFGDSDNVRPGDPVLAIGNPHGLGFSASTGIVSARNRSLQGAYDDFLQTDAAINLGNSGGPLFNMDGEVVGVNTAILGNANSGGGSMGIGFSMSSNVVTKVVTQLKEFGTTRRGWLGVRLQSMDGDLADALGLDSAEGALVAEVLTGPANDAGVKSGDVIVGFGGQPVPDTRELVRMVGDAPVGDTTTLEIIRDQEPITLEVVLGHREVVESTAVPASLSNDPPKETSLLGMKLGELTPEVREELNLGDDDKGLVVLDVELDTDAWEKNIEKGDVLVKIGNDPIESVSDFLSGVENAREAGRKSVLALLQRGENTAYVALSIE